LSVEGAGHGAHILGRDFGVVTTPVAFPLNAGPGSAIKADLAMIPRRYVSPVLLASVVVIATSGLVYELIAGTIASYVLGDSVLQFSLVIGLYLFAMGVGSYLSRFLEHRLLERFVDIELAIALVGGSSAPLLFGVYTSMGSFQAALYIVVSLGGLLVGLEIPILIRLLKFQLDLKELVARVLSLDYVGALVASLLFGMLNAAVAFLATFLMDIRHVARWRMRAQCVTLMVALGVGMVVVDRAVLASESFYFGAPIVYARQSPYQRIVLTQSRTTTRLFLNGNLQFSSDDEHRYHEVLVHPAVAALGRDPRQVLILGGGDGLAARELLRYPSIERIVLVDLDPAVTHVFREVPLGVKLNAGALNDPKVEVRNEDAYGYLDTSSDSFDLAVVDFPDPSNYALGKLYTLSFYQRLRERVGVRGVTVVQSTSPYYARKAFWMIAGTMEAAGFETLPMHVYVPSFGEWGFVLAGGKGLRQPTATRLDNGPLRFLDDRALAELFHFPRDMSRVDGPINRLNDQQLIPVYTKEWEDWAR
jgi:spermidine synthase